MRSAVFVLVLLLLALVFIPPALPVSGSSLPGESTDSQKNCFGCRAGTTMADMMSSARSGMMRRAGGAMPFPPGARHHDDCSAEDQVRQELRRDPSDWNTPVRTIRLRGYRRLSGKNILDHEKRQVIFSTILMNPGIEIPALACLTGINLHTLRYHLGQLMQMKKIACIEQGGGYHFFENHGRYGSAEQQRILFQRYPTTSRILYLIGAHPGITRGAIAAELGLAGPSVTRWTQRLIDEGVVTGVRNGRQVHYYLVQGSGSIPVTP